MGVRPTASQTSCYERRLVVDSQPTTIIAPSRGWTSFGVGEVWRYRELLYFFVWRDIKVRYKQTLLGVTWAVLQPLFTMAVFTIFLGRLAGIPSDGVPYPLFAYSGLVPWIYFANSVTTSSDSLVNGAILITRVFFPRVLLPLASVVAGLVDFGMAFLVLIVMIVLYQLPFSSAVLLTPVFVLLAVVTAVGVGLWLAALNVRYRDIRYTVPFLVQIWLFATPVVYPASLVPDKWRALYGLNPMVGVVEGFRWCLLHVGDPPSDAILVSVTVAVLLLVSGGVYFRRAERTFADVV